MYNPILKEAKVLNIVIMSMPVHHSVDYPGMSIMPPSAIYLLGGILKNNGYNVEIIDPYYFRKLNPIETSQDSELQNYLKEKLKNVEVLCVSSNTLNWSMSKIVCEAVRCIYPNIKIILGGLHPTYFDEYIMRTNPIDYILRGDGEKSLLCLIRAIENRNDFENIPGLTWKKNGKVVRNQEVMPLCDKEIKELPYPDFAAVPNQIYGIIPVETSKGCKYACRFCSIPHKHDWIGYEAEWASDRLLNIIEKYGEKYSDTCVYIVDDCFTADNERAINILTRILEKNSQVKLILEARASDLKDTRLLEILQSPQIIRVAVGVECGYDRGLKSINKGLTIELLEQRLQMFKKFNLIQKMFFSFIIGFPWEKLEDYKLTMDYAASIVKRFGYQNVNLNWLNLFPSDIWEKRKKYGIMFDEDIFDQHGFIKDKNIFKAAHPQIDEYALEYVQNYIGTYQSKGISLHNG